MVNIAKKRISFAMFSFSVVLMLTDPSVGDESVFILTISLDDKLWS